MLLGMGIVFIFLIILIIYMKSVPILSKIKRSRKTETAPTIAGSPTVQSPSKQKLNTVLHQLTDQDTHTVANEPAEVTVAAIAAAICAHTGKAPKQIVITTPAGTTQQINLWAAAGRQDIMLTRDITGQVGFQY